MNANVKETDAKGVSKGGGTTLRWKWHQIRRGETQKEQEENIRRRMIFLLIEEKKDGEGEGWKYLEKDNIREGKYIFFVEEKITEEGKGGKYLEKDNILFINGEGKYLE